MILQREIFGAPECPLLYRWKLAGFGDGPKLMLHWFLPNRSETDFHDHPRSFVTVVLWGSYEDVRLAPSGAVYDGVLDRVKAPTVRFRRAEHTHYTVAGPHGCLTLALFGRRRRRWGFWRAGEWWPWQAYEQRFGSRFRCPE